MINFAFFFEFKKVNRIYLELMLTDENARDATELCCCFLMLSFSFQHTLIHLKWSESRWTIRWRESEYCATCRGTAKTCVCEEQTHACSNININVWKGENMEKEAALGIQSRLCLCVWKRTFHPSRKYRWYMLVLFSPGACVQDASRSGLIQVCSPQRRPQLNSGSLSDGGGGFRRSRKPRGMEGWREALRFTQHGVAYLWPTER